MENKEFIIKIEGDKNLKVTLRPMLFQDYRNAAMVMNETPGYVDKIGAGSSVVQHCWVSGDEQLKGGDESQDVVISKAYASLCNSVYYEMVQIFEVEIKKK